VIRGLLSHAFSSRSLELMRSRLEHRAAEQLAVFVAPGPPVDLVVRGPLHGGKTSFGMLKRMCRSCRVRLVLPPRSAFAGFRFPREVIVLAVRWYLRYGLS
jgi:hypothetical protein